MALSALPSRCLYASPRREFQTQISNQTDSLWLSAVAAGDRSVGGHVLGELYRQHARVAVDVDLEGIFRRLGVRLEAGQVEFDDGAEWAALRSALTAPAALQRAQAGLSSPGVPKSPL